MFCIIPGSAAGGARAFRYDSEDIARARRNETRAAEAAGAGVGRQGALR